MTPAVMDHGKRDMSGFPIATGAYYKVNYAPGTDVSRCKNIPAPTSYKSNLARRSYAQTTPASRMAHSRTLAPLPHGFGHGSCCGVPVEHNRCALFRL